MKNCFEEKRLVARLRPCGRVITCRVGASAGPNWMTASSPQRFQPVEKCAASAASTWIVACVRHGAGGRELSMAACTLHRCNEERAQALRE